MEISLFVSSSFVFFGPKTKGCLTVFLSHDVASATILVIADIGQQDFNRIYIAVFLLV